MKAGEAEFYDEHYHVESKEAWWHRRAFDILAKSDLAGARILDVGCGDAHLLRKLVDRGLVHAGNAIGFDQSSVAIARAKNMLPHADLRVDDVYTFTLGDYDEEKSTPVDICVMLEVIEHLTYPYDALRTVHRAIKTHGKLVLSFPNYLNLPWLAARILAEMTDNPNWVCLQPIDKIYAYPWLIRMVERTGFKFKGGYGSLYFPPIFYKMEPRWISRFLDPLGLWRLSFHPVLVFEAI